MPSSENSTVVIRALKVLQVDPTTRDLATALLLTDWIIQDEPEAFRESVMALARTVILDAEIADLKAKLSA